MVKRTSYKNKDMLIEENHLLRNRLKELFMRGLIKGLYSIKRKIK